MELLILALTLEELELVLKTLAEEISDEVWEPSALLTRLLRMLLEELKPLLAKLLAELKELA